MATSKISGRQIKDGAVKNNHIASDADIALSKIAGGTSLIKADGTVAMTGALNMGNQKITNVGTPTTTTDAANKAYIDNLFAGLNSLFKYKNSVRAASTVAVTISNPGTSVFDGITLTNGQRVLLKNQANPVQNGIYIFNGSTGAMTRATDFDAWDEIPGALVPVEDGTVSNDTLWLSTADAGGTLGTTNITFTPVQTSSGYNSSNFVTEETAAGDMNGLNVSFVLANMPIAGTVVGYLNGIRLSKGAGKDYTITGANITMLEAPLADDVLVWDYHK